jgi:alpha-methylacyl-CoA racemase
MGPLEGIKVVEMAGIGPAPFAAMLLSDMGAEVLRVDRAGAGPGMVPREQDPTQRGRARIGVDLKSDAGRELVLELCAGADALIEGFRPGVMERLGLGPDVALERNPRLVYGRMTGYGQDGPMARVAGHDINYISLAGALGATAREGERPLFALNLVGDYGGGALFLALGVVSALLEARGSGRGQVVDAAMVEGAALLTALIYGLGAAGAWTNEPGTNLLDSGAPFYEVYATSDGGHVALGALEPQFYARLLELLEIDAAEFPQGDRDRWPALRARFAEVLGSRPAAEWQTRLEGEDACATVVARLFDAPAHPHNVARGTFVELGGVLQPGPAPRFSRTPAQARPARSDAEAVLADAWGIDAARLAGLRDAGAVD